MWEPEQYNPLGEYRERLACYGLDCMAKRIDAIEHRLIYREKKA